MKNQWPFSIPDKERALSILIWGPIATLAFAVIYGACNKMAVTANWHYPMFFEFEKSIPLIPWMIYPYLSLNALFILAAFVLNKNAVKGYCLSIVWGAIIAGIIFYFFPGQLGFERVSQVHGYEKLFQAMHEIDQPHNLFPSLHVTYSSLSMWSMIHQSRNDLFKWFLNFWLVMIAASVILVHQHHLFDIVTGFLLAIALYKSVYLRYAEPKGTVLAAESVV
ncbi:MAG: hypothetical protein Fur0010_14400 [Bdellovibrio sp.]